MTDEPGDPMRPIRCILPEGEGHIVAMTSDESEVTVRMNTGKTIKVDARGRAQVHEDDLGQFIKFLPQ